VSPPSWLPTAIFVPLVGFLLYRRFKRTFGRQRVVAWRMILRIALLTVIGALLIATSPVSTASFAATIAGLALGGALAVVGLRWTTFEATSEGRFYVPNGWIGLAVTALFVGRMAARIFTLSERVATAHAGDDPFAGVQRSPLTLGLFCLLAAYYVGYYAGVLRKARRIGATT
jgi:hypothetical protein